jgi:hypothetical protein
LTFAVTVAVAIAATRSDPPWRLTALALGAALMTAAAALLVAMANALDGISFSFRWADHIAASVLRSSSRIGSSVGGAPVGERRDLMSELVRQFQRTA